MQGLGADCHGADGDGCYLCQAQTVSACGYSGCPKEVCYMWNVNAEECCSRPTNTEEQRSCVHPSAYGKMLPSQYNNRRYRARDQDREQWCQLQRNKYPAYDEVCYTREGSVGPLSGLACPWSVKTPCKFTKALGGDF